MPSCFAEADDDALCDACGFSNFGTLDKCDLCDAALPKQPWHSSQQLASTSVPCKAVNPILLELRDGLVALMTQVDAMVPTAQKRPRDETPRTFDASKRLAPLSIGSSMPTPQQLDAADVEAFSSSSAPPASSAPPLRVEASGGSTSSDASTPTLASSQPLPSAARQRPSKPKAPPPPKPYYEVHALEGGKKLRILAPDLGDVYPPRTRILTYTPGSRLLICEDQVSGAGVGLATPSRSGRRAARESNTMLYTEVVDSEWSSIAGAATPEEWTARSEEVMEKAHAAGHKFAAPQTVR